MTASFARKKRLRDAVQTGNLDGLSPGETKYAIRLRELNAQTPLPTPMSCVRRREVVPPPVSDGRPVLPFRGDIELAKAVYRANAQANKEVIL